MDILPLHIEYLLSRHDCVIVPGLGAFIATETEAHIDLEAGIIRPRRRDIGFNSSVVTDDGLLTHSIARRQGLPYEEARRMVGHLAEKMSADLEEEGEVSLGMIGRLVKDSEGLVSFQPRLSSARSDIMPELMLVQSATAADTGLQATDFDVKPTEEEDGMRIIRVSPDRYVFTVSKRAVHAAAMLVAVLTIGLSLLVPINHDNEQKASVISLDEFFRRPVENFVYKALDSTSVTSEDNDSVSIEVPSVEVR